MSWFSNLLSRLGGHTAAGEGDAIAEPGLERVLTDNALRMISPVAAPGNLALRLRVAMSKEVLRRERRWSGRLKDAAELFIANRIGPFAVHLGAVAAAVIATATGLAMLGTMTPQLSVQAHDEPLAGFSAPRYLYSFEGSQPLAGVGDAPLIVKAQIDASGRVYDYTVLSGTLDQHAAEALRQRMLAGVFRPARVFDQPVRGSIVLTFADVMVRA